MRTSQLFGVFLKKPNSDYIDISNRSILAWVLDVNRDREIIARTRPLPNRYPAFLIVKAPDSAGVDEFRGSIYGIGCTPLDQSPIVVAFGLEDLGVLPISCWQAQDSETFRFPEKYLLAEPTGHCWRLEHASGGLGNGPVQVILRAIRT